MRVDSVVEVDGVAASHRGGGRVARVEAEVTERRTPGLLVTRAISHDDVVKRLIRLRVAVHAGGLPPAVVIPSAILEKRGVMGLIGKNDLVCVALAKLLRCAWHKKMAWRSALGVNFNSSDCEDEPFPKNQQNDENSNRHNDAGHSSSNDTP